MLRRWMLAGALGAAVLCAPMARAQNRPPMADAGADRFTYVGAPLLLQGGGSDADGDLIRDVLWHVDTAPPGAQYLLETPNYPYSAFVAGSAGRFGLSFSVFDGLAWSAPDTMEILAVVNQPPIARLTVVPTTGTSPLKILFDAAPSEDPEGRPLTYYWSFGDGSAGSYEANGAHVYDVPGTFTVSLDVTDEVGAVAQASQVVTVQRFNRAPAVSPLVEMLTGGGARFQAGAIDADQDPLTYLWNFGDPSSADNLSTLPDPVHWFSQPGHYVTTLTVDDGRASTQMQMALDIITVPEPGGWALCVTALLAMAASRSHRAGRVR